MTDQSATPRSLASIHAADAAYGVAEGFAWFDALFRAIQRSPEDDARSLASIGQYLVERIGSNTSADFKDLNTELAKLQEVSA